MLAALAAVEPVVQQTFAEASAVLGYDLWALCGRAGGRPWRDRAYATGNARRGCGHLASVAFARRSGAKGNGRSQPGRILGAGVLERARFRAAVDLVRYRDA